MPPGDVSLALRGVFLPHVTGFRHDVMFFVGTRGKQNPSHRVKIVTLAKKYHIRQKTITWVNKTITWGKKTVTSTNESTKSRTDRGAKPSHSLWVWAAGPSGLAGTQTTPVVTVTGFGAQKPVTDTTSWSYFATREDRRANASEGQEGGQSP